MQLPSIDPVIFSFGGIAIRWYSVAYVLGIVLAWLIMLYFNRNLKLFDSKKFSDDFFMYMVLSIVIGGRLGYVLFYNFGFYITHPLDIFKLWEGGMSFHGGLAGVVCGTYLLARKYNIKFFALTDLMAIGTPIGLLFGRIANFINLELYGRETESKFGIIFPNAGELPRHPSQLYEAFSEGLILFVLLFCIAKFTNALKHNGLISGLFLIGYAIARFIVEFFREPDFQIGYILNVFTMGQVLTIPVMAAGAVIVYFSCRDNIQ